LELFGLLASVPVSFVASMAYCALLACAVRSLDRVRRLMISVSLVLLALFVGELALLRVGRRAGACGGRPGGGLAHIVCKYFFVTPPLANVLILGRCVSFARGW
jgi:hypothetical protein